MELKRSLITSIAIAAGVLAPTAALADGFGRGYHRTQQQAPQHHHSGDCGHGNNLPPAPAPRPHGRYELQTVQKHVDGYWVKDYVPETCRQRGRSHKVKCKGGYYVDRFVPAHYETVQEWVFVPYSRPGWQVSMRW